MSDQPLDYQAKQPRSFAFSGFYLHKKIRTGEKQAPWSGVFMLSMLWFTWGFNIFAGGVSLTFTIRKYVNNPQVISLVMTIATVIMLGPFISYLSDQIWTRSGRRKPFLIVAWLGGFLAMGSFAFLPSIAGAINHVLVAVGLKPVGELIVLAVVIACYKKMWDGAETLEPLFMESVPPHQRGRFWAIRGMLFSLAVMMFYQILWPMYDRNIDMLDWFGHPGHLYMTGERCIYVLASGLFLLTGVFVVFCVEETRLLTAPNRSISEALADNFVVKLIKDVFLKAENWPYYVVLIIPGIEAMVWGNYNQLMQNDQFHYSKRAQADWAFPMMIMATFILPVFAGWYSDVRSNVRWWLRIAMLMLSAGCFIAMLKVLHLYSPEDIRALPSFKVISALTVLAAVSMVMLYIPTVETMLDFSGREDARAWVALLTVVKSMISTGLLYLYIQHCKDQTPPILVWMLFSVVGTTLGALMDTFIGPMIFDYMPRSNMGTINAGKGVIETAVKFGAANMGAWWIVFFSAHIRTPLHSKYDYTSMYILQFMLFVPAILAKLYFIRLIVKGKMRKLGAMEVETPTDAIIEEKLVQMETVGSQ